jgi:lysophospholipase L1-like esterase
MRLHAFFAGLALAGATAPAAAQPLNVSQYVALGDSFLAGVVSDALVETHQASSIPTLIARQAGVPQFTQPLVTEPGIPAELALISLGATATIGPKATQPGAPRNVAGAIHNLSIPNTTAADLVSRPSDSGGMHDVVLRGRGTALAQAMGLKPTLVTIWIGNDEILNAVRRGRAVEGVTLTPAATFRFNFQTMVANLRNSGATVVVGNIMDMTQLPFVTTIKPYATDPSTGLPVRVSGQLVPLLGPNGPLPEGTLVSLVASRLIAQGEGVPTTVGGKGTALPDELILDAAEQAQIRARIADFNRAIEEVCKPAGIPIVDAYGFYEAFVKNGRQIAGIQVTNQFLTGGFWSYDGTHPTELGYAMLANEWIAALNSVGGEMATVGLAPYLGAEPPARGSSSR